MLIPMTLEITGAVPSVFQINDYHEDCVNVSALVQLSTDDGGIGRGAEVLKYKTSSAIKEFENVGLEKGIVIADCKVEYVKKGKKSVLILREISFKSQTITKAN